MSQISNEPQELDHYRENLLVVEDLKAQVPQELENPRPVQSSSSGWKTAGRVLLGIGTCGLSEVFRWAWRGIMSCCCSSRPAPGAAPRIRPGSAALPQAAPNEDKMNDLLFQSLRDPDKKAFPPEYSAALDGVLAELRAGYGGDLIPPGKDMAHVLRQYPDLSTKDPLYLVVTAVRNAKQALSPNELCRIVKDAMRQALNWISLCKEARDISRDLGGLGGLDTERLIDKLMNRPGMQEKLERCSSTADIRELAGEMDLAGTLEAYRDGMEEAAAEMRAVYGNDVVPEDLKEVLELKDTLDQTIKGNLERQLLDDGPFPPQRCKDYIKEQLASACPHILVQRSVREAADALKIPVNRRSIVALSKYLLKQDVNVQRFRDAASPADLRSAVENMDIPALLRQQQAGIQKMMEAHSGRVKPELKPLLQEFIAGLSFAPPHAAASEAAVENMAARMQEWKDIDGTEQERAAFNQGLKDYFDEDLAKLADAPGQAGKFQDDIFNVMVADAHRNRYIINGQQIECNGEDNGKPLVDAVKQAVPNAKDRQLLSKILNQATTAQLTSLSMTGLMPDGTPLDNVPGGKVYPCMPGCPTLVSQDRTAHLTYDATVSADKKTAVITISAPQVLHYPDGMDVDGRKPIFGCYTATLTLHVRLSAHEQGRGVDGVSVGLRFSPLSEAHKGGAVQAGS